MPTLAIVKSYVDGDILLEADIDEIRNALLTFLNTTKIDNSNVQADGVLPTNIACDEATIDGTGATLKVKDAGIVTAKIADVNVTTAKIADANVTTAKIADANVTTAKIADVNVTTAKIADANVTTAKIADVNVTRAKLVAVGKQTSASSGAYSMTSTTFATPTNMSVTITTSGGPVVLAVLSADTTNLASIEASRDVSPVHAYTRFIRDGAQISINEIRSTTTIASATIITLPPSLIFIDPVGAGTYTYAFQVRVVDGTSNSAISCRYCQLVAYELY